MSERRREPIAWPIERILSAFAHSPGEALIVDDLKPAVLMGRASGVAVAGAGWGHDSLEIRSYMRRNCAVFLPQVRDFRNCVLA